MSKKLQPLAKKKRKESSHYVCRVEASIADHLRGFAPTVKKFNVVYLCFHVER